MMTDPIADMLTRMRNALRNKRKHVEVPISTVKESIVKVLAREGYIGGYEVLDSGKPRKSMKIALKYDADDNHVIQKIERVSKPGCRVYRRADQLRPILGGMGIAVLSTNQGMLSDRECRKSKVGGEVICNVW